MLKDLNELTSHDRDFTTRAVTERAERVQKIAKAASEAGYEKEATVLRGDAAYAVEELLPAFRLQAEIFPKSAEECRAGMANIVHEVLSKAKVEHWQPPTIADKLADRIFHFGREVYERAYAAGVADRQQYAMPSLLISSLAGLRNGDNPLTTIEGNTVSNQPVVIGTTLPLPLDEPPVKRPKFRSLGHQAKKVSEAEARRLAKPGRGKK